MMIKERKEKYPQIIIVQFRCFSKTDQIGRTVCDCASFLSQQYRLWSGNPSIVIITFAMKVNGGEIKGPAEVEIVFFFLWSCKISDPFIVSAAADFTSRWTAQIQSFSFDFHLVGRLLQVHRQRWVSNSQSQCKFFKWLASSFAVLK